MLRFLDQLLFSHHDPLFLQLRASVNDLNLAINAEISRIKISSKNIVNKKFSVEEVDLKMKDVEMLFSIYPYTKKLLTKSLFQNIKDYLLFLPEDGYLTPEGCFYKGKSRDYLSHVENFYRKIDDKDGLILDLAGRTGWTSTILNYLGCTQANTIELNPINVIGGRYIWGHENIYQGDVTKLSEFDGTKIPNMAKSLESMVSGIFCRYSLEHFSDLHGFYQGCNFVLKPDGILHLIVGQSDKVSLSTGDVNIFPDLDSVYKMAENFRVIEKSQEINSQTKANQFFITLQKI